MRRSTFALAIIAALAGLPTLSGCERELEHSKRVEVKDDGTKVTKEKTVTEDKQTDEVTRTEGKKVEPP
jgi:hypothetical protein